MSGKYWENHYSSSLLKSGFERLPGWECTFVHQTLCLVMSACVDDFKLAGLTESAGKGWGCVRSRIRAGHAHQVCASLERLLPQRLYRRELILAMAKVASPPMGCHP